MLRSSVKHRRTSKTVRYITFAGVAGAAVAAPLLATTSASAASSSQWDQVAQCEAGGNWSTNTGNGFYGGLQFTPSTWAAYGGTAYAPQANMASKSEQIAIGEKVLAGQGKGAWPNCGTGLTSGGSAPAPVPARHTQEHTSSARSEVRSESVHTGAQASRGTTRSFTIEKGDGNYKVKGGDTLSTIADAQHVKGGWKKLFDLNSDIVRNADMIYPGQMLHLS